MHAKTSVPPSSTITFSIIVWLQNGIVTLYRMSQKSTFSQAIWSCFSDWYDADCFKFPQKWINHVQNLLLNYLTALLHSGDFTLVYYQMEELEYICMTDNCSKWLNLFYWSNNLTHYLLLTARDCKFFHSSVFSLVSFLTTLLIFITSVFSILVKSLGLNEDWPVCVRISV